MSISPTCDDVSSDRGQCASVVPVSARGQWYQGLVLAGTVNTIAAASTSASANAIYLADAAGTTSIYTGFVILVPAQCTYMEVMPAGDASSIGTAPIIMFTRTHGMPTNTNKRGSPDLWQVMCNINGSATTTFGGTVRDMTGVAGASRYTMAATTNQDFVYDLLGARIVVARLTTVGTNGNWSLWHRFF